MESVSGYKKKKKESGPQKVIRAICRDYNVNAHVDVPDRPDLKAYDRRKRYLRNKKRAELLESQLHLIGQRDGQTMSGSSGKDLKQEDLASFHCSEKADASNIQSTGYDPQPGPSGVSSLQKKGSTLDQETIDMTMNYCAQSLFEENRSDDDGQSQIFISRTQKRTRDKSVSDNESGVTEDAPETPQTKKPRIREFDSDDDNLIGVSRHRFRTTSGSSIETDSDVCEQEDMKRNYTEAEILDDGIEHDTFVETAFEFEKKQPTKFDYDSLSGNDCESSNGEEDHADTINDGDFPPMIVDGCCISEDGKYLYANPRKGKLQPTYNQAEFSKFMESIKDLGRNEAVQKLENYFMIASANLHLNETQADAWWAWICASYREKYGKMPCYKTVRNKYYKKLPPIKIDILLRNRETHEIIVIDNVAEFPRRLYKAYKFETLDEWTFHSVKELYDFHRFIHKIEDDTPVAYDLSVDGIPVTVSGIDKVNVCCIRFELCRLIYVLAMHKTRHGTTKKTTNLLEPLLVDAYEQGFTLCRCLCDAPMRAEMLNMKGHSGFCSCSKCEIIGTTDASATKKTVLFPSYMAQDQEKRTHEKWMDILAKIEDAKAKNIKLTDEVTKGIKGPSILLKIPGFDIVKDVPLEPLHLLFLGCTRGLMKRMLNIRSGSGEFPERIMKILRKFDESWTKVNLPSEFSRKPRELTKCFRNLKGEEFCAIVTCGFVQFADAFEGDQYIDERRMFLRFAFIINAALKDDRLWLYCQKYVDLQKLQAAFYKWIDIYDIDLASYNWHAFSHLVETRVDFSLDDISTENYEGNYGYLMSFLVNNTQSYCKSVMLKANLLNMREHSCQKTIRISTSRGKRDGDDSIILANDMTYYEVQEEDETTYKCHLIKTSKFTHPEASDLNFDAILVRRFKYVLHADELIEIPKPHVRAKGVIHGDIIYCLSFPALFV